MIHLNLYIVLVGVRLVLSYVGIRLIFGVMSYDGTQFPLSEASWEISCESLWSCFPPTQNTFDINNIYRIWFSFVDPLIRNLEFKKIISLNKDENYLLNIAKNTDEKNDKYYSFMDNQKKKEINPDTKAATISGKGLCHSSGLVMKKAKNSPINISVKS